MGRATGAELRHGLHARGPGLLRQERRGDSLRRGDHGQFAGHLQLGDRRGPAAGCARANLAVPREPDATEVRVAALLENEETLLGQVPCGGPSAAAGNRRLSCTGVNALVARRPSVLSLWAADGDDRRHRQPAHRTLRARPRPCRRRQGRADEFLRAAGRGAHIRSLVLERGHGRQIQPHGHPCRFR